MPPPSPPPAQSSSGFACSTCGRQYQHSSHLRRHEATHRGSDEFKCQYCGRVFGRRDVWRKHYTSCPQNNNHDEPPPAKRGKKPRACDACYRSKVSCDGASPCARCTTRQAPCTYSRVQVDVPDAPLPSPGLATTADTTPSMTTGDSPVTLPPAPPSSSSFHRADHTKIPVSFLLSLTNPEADSMVRVFLREPCRDIDVPGALFMPDAGIPADETQEAAPIDELFFPWLHSDMYPDLWSDPNSFHLPQLATPKPEAVDPALAPIVSELEFLHHTLIASDPSYAGTAFDPVLAREVFVTSNCDAFVALYFQHTHKHLPLIHRPSFSTSRSSPALVLAILLCGAVYAPPRDAVLAIPRFFRIAEQYIFGRLESQLKLARGGLEDAAVDAISLREDMELEMYETIQAAMLIQGAQFMMNSPGARSRAWVVRKGGLVDAIRVLGLTKARHSQEAGGVVDWEKWVRDEMRIRIAIWTILSDWQHSGVTHTPWHMTIHEMTGDAPCLQELWEANNPAVFEAVVAAKGRDCWRRSASLRDCMDAFMADPWSGITGFPLRNVTLLDLHIFITAIHVMIGSARLLSMLPAGIPAFQRATDRWEEMWRETVSQFDEEELRMCGMVRHAGEFCWLAKAMLKYALEGKDRTNPYYQRIGHKSLKELHNLLRELRELSV